MNNWYSEAAFLVASPLLKVPYGVNQALTARRLPPRRKVSTRACLPPQTTKEDLQTKTGAEGKSKTEKIAALLGQSREQMEEKARIVKEQDIRDRRRKYGLALLSTFIGTSLFLLRYFDPERDTTIMKVLQSTSAPIEVVGTNSKPTIIEFSAYWCENCRAMANRVYELKNDYGDEVNFVVVDGDDPARQEIVNQFGVDAIPQFSLIDKNGRVMGNLIGMVPKESLRQDLEALVQEKTLPFPGLSLDDLFAPYS